MKLWTILLLAAVLAFAGACGGVDSELVASGKVHSCAIQELERNLAADPENAELQNELEDRRALLETVISTGESPADLASAIAEAAQNCP